MANDLFPTTSLNVLLEYLRTGKLEGSNLALYEGTHVPNPADTLSTYTAIETNFGGYSRQGMSGWTSSALAGTAEYTQAPFATFSPSSSPGTNIVTGYFLVLSDGTLGAAGKLAGPIMVSASTPFSMVLQITLKSS
jgi:hypothetical protein